MVAPARKMIGFDEAAANSLYRAVTGAVAVPVPLDAESAFGGSQEPPRKGEPALQPA